MAIRLDVQPLQLDGRAAEISNAGLDGASRKHYKAEDVIWIVVRTSNHGVFVGVGQIGEDGGGCEGFGEVELEIRWWDRVTERGGEDIAS